MIDDRPSRIGRPSKPDDQKRQQIGVRTSPALKAQLEAAAAENGRSVAQEAEFRLLQSFQQADIISTIREELRWLSTGQAA